MADILIIEDSATTRNILKSTLEGKGHRVIEAPDGEQGLKLAQSEIPDLILLDLLLPGIDGWQVCEQLRKLPRVKDIPIIMLTQLNQSMYKFKGWEAGADDYIFKTDDLSPLLYVIEKWLKIDPA